MDYGKFIDMMGVLGRTYLCEWIFAAMDEDWNGVVSLGEFLNYYDIMLNGTVTEKWKQNFNMMDISKSITDRGTVNYP